MVAALTSWNAGTWLEAIAIVVAVAIAVMGGASRARRLRKPVVFRRAHAPGHLMDPQVWPRPPIILDPSEWYLARAVLQVDNRSDSDQTILIRWPRQLPRWLRRRGFYVATGRMVIPAHKGGWIGLCVVIVNGKKFRQRDRVLVRIRGRLANSGKRVGFTGFARLYQYPDLDGAEFRGGQTRPAS